MKPPLRIGIIGMGGFAGWHHDVVAQLETRGEARLICTCDPRADEFTAQRERWHLNERVVSVFDDYRTMIDRCHSELDLVVVPTPIQLHAAMHEAATARGLPVYLEKPPTLDYAELEQMIDHDRAARKASLVGFNFIIERTRLALKERILAGEFGAVRGATLTGMWPRPVAYFHRNTWAGRLLIDGHLVLDSCLGNALAHFVHNLLFWAGRDQLFSWAQLAAVRAELYRVHAIEGADTFFVEADTTEGVTMRFALSHACSGVSSQTETVVCERANVTYVIGQSAEVRWLDGRIERIPLSPFDCLEENYLDYFRYLRGESTRPATTLVDSRPFVALNDLAYVSCGRITPVPAARVTAERDAKEQKNYLVINGLAGAQEIFALHGIWPGANGWNREPAEVVTLADLPRFREVIRSMTEQRT